MMLLIGSWAVILSGFLMLGNMNAKEQADSIAGQAMTNMNRNVTTLISDVAYYSRIILSSSAVTDTLAARDQEAQKRALHQFISLVDAETHISGIYMWDLDNHVSSIDLNQARVPRAEQIQETSWYEEVCGLGGAWCLKLNADRVLSQSGMEPVVSLIRLINSPVDYQPIGILMLNISAHAFEERMVSGDEDHITDVYLLDDTGKIVCSDAEQTLPALQEALGRTDSAWARLDGKRGKLWVYREQVEKCGWTILVAVRARNWLLDSRLAFIVFPGIIVLLTGLCVISLIYTRRRVAAPFEYLSRSMNQMRGNQFKKIERNGGTASFLEVEVLRDTYNHMVDEIDALILRVHEEERIKRLMELSALQEQMKPHFLYNTIDAMEYLALSGENEELYGALEAFGGYYRILLSKGQEKILVREEISMVRDYLELQKIRYGDSLRYQLEVEEGMQGRQMLKMLLQPLVENAVNHGIRPKGTAGTVYVTGHEENGYLAFAVEDDGVGMSEEELENLQQGKLGKNEKSFGLRGTIERMRIFYEEDIEYRIRSAPGKGTTITIKIPMCSEANEHDKSLISGG